MNNCCCAELVVDEGQQIELNVESDGGIEVGVAEQFVIGGGGNYQDKTVNITPTESAQSQTVRADVGYDALDEVEVNVAAVSDTYVGSAVPRKNSANVAINGAKFTAPAGYYASDAEKTMTTGHMSVSATKGTVSNHSVAVTPKAAVDNAGYFATGDRTGTAVTVSASELDSGTKSITSNGNSQDVVGYATVDVAVPNSYTSADEGKVVDNGALVSQTSDTVTTNGTVDTTLINSLTVNVSGGGGYQSTSGSVNLVTSGTTLTFPCTFQPDFVKVTGELVTLSTRHCNGFYFHTGNSFIIRGRAANATSNSNFSVGIGNYAWGEQASQYCKAEWDSETNTVTLTCRSGYAWVTGANPYVYTAGKYT